MVLITLLMALLAVVAAVVVPLRLRSRKGGVGGLDDAQIRRIEETGRLEVDEPLDREEIQAEEKRFWEESWDEPEEW